MDEHEQANQYQAGSQYTSSFQAQPVTQTIGTTTPGVQAPTQNPEKERLAAMLAAAVESDEKLRPEWVRAFLEGRMSIEELEKKRNSSYSLGPERVAFIFDGMLFIGLDGLLSVLEFVLDFVGIGELIQVGGDIFTTIIPGVLMLSYAVDRQTKMKMVKNLAIDYLVGLIPFVGPVFDIFFKAHKRNLEVLRRER